MKRIAAIHDISGFGRCSLTVALPIISAAGITVSCIPTAVLSTHTGGFEGYTFRDLTEDILPIANHWKSLNLEFDAIYSGYLGSIEQIDDVCEIIDKFKTENSVAIVDPAMADNGKMYACFDMNFANEMALLCKKADIILPNITEAAFMTGQEYLEGPYTKEYIENLIFKLAKLGPAKICLTGVYFEESKLGVATYTKESGKIEYYFTDRIPKMYHGTGDVFASCFTAAFVKGFDFYKSSQIAADFTAFCVKHSAAEGHDNRFGVDFEACLPMLMKELEII